MGNFGDCAPQRAVTLIRKSCRSDESLKTSVVAGVFSFLEYEITLDLQRSSSQTIGNLMRYYRCF